LWLGWKSLVQRFVSFKTDEASYHTRLQIARDSFPTIKAAADWMGTRDLYHRVSQVPQLLRQRVH
jgi:hypothetical protein